MSLPPLARLPEDIPWDALAAVFAADASDAQRELVDRWLLADPRHEEVAAVLRRGWEANGATRRSYDAEAALRWIKRQAADGAADGAAEPVGGRPDRRSRPLALTPAPRGAGMAVRALLAASLAAVAAGGWWATTRTAESGDVANGAGTEYRTAGGQRLALRLSDGSSVVLGPASTLRVADGYGRSARAVELDGAAYFEVPHDEARPFSVRTARTLVRDLGTRFVVDAYADEPVTDVVVSEGSVAVGKPRAAGADVPSRPLSADSLVLRPGERGRLGGDGALVRSAGADVDLDAYLAWTHGRLVFRDTPLPEAIRRVARWYDVRIRLADSALAGRTLTAAFRDEPAGEVVRLIAAPFGLRVERDGDEFVLRSGFR